jgi:hypothetical protein
MTRLTNARRLACWVLLPCLLSTTGCSSDGKDRSLGSEEKKSLDGDFSVFKSQVNAKRELWPQDDWEHLLCIYRRHDQHESAAAVCSEAMQFYPDERRWYKERSMCYEKMLRNNLAKIDWETWKGWDKRLKSVASTPKPAEVADRVVLAPKAEPKVTPPTDPFLIFMRDLPTDGTPLTWNGRPEPYFKSPDGAVHWSGSGWHTLDAGVWKLHSFSTSVQLVNGKYKFVTAQATGNTSQSSGTATGGTR